MATVSIRNINPLGDIELPLLGRVITAGEEFNVTKEQAGRSPSVEVIDGEEIVDPGEGLLAQVGNFEEVKVNLDKMKLDDLKLHAQQRGIEFKESATKADLIAAIKRG